jgi:hypothetical protein
VSYSIFRVKGIKTLSDLRGIGKHDKERVSHTNPDIDHGRSNENIELVPCNVSYRQRFNEITAEMRKEHEERMAKTRADRRKTFEQAVDTARNDVAAEFLFTSDESFFENKSKEEIREWAEKSLEFLEKDIGIQRDKIIHAVVHMDEKTPHLHVVAVPLVKAYDGRRKADTWQISRKKFIKTKEDLARLQDVYNKRMNEAGFQLQRGNPKSDRLHVPTEVLKKETKYYEQKFKTIHQEYEFMMKKLEKAKELADDKPEQNRPLQVDYFPPMPELVAKKTIMGVKYDPEQVEALQRWGREMIAKSHKDNQTIQVQNKKIQMLQEMVQLQEKEMNARAEQKVSQKNSQLIVKLKQAINDVNIFRTENERLRNENSRLKKQLSRREWLMEKMVIFMQKLGVFERFERWVGIEKTVDKGHDMER